MESIVVTGIPCSHRLIEIEDLKAQPTPNLSNLKFNNFFE